MSDLGEELIQAVKRAFNDKAEKNKPDKYYIGAYYYLMGWIFSVLELHGQDKYETLKNIEKYVDEEIP